MMPLRSNLALQLTTFLILPLLVLLVVVAFGGVALHQAEMRDMLVDHHSHIVPGAAASLSDELAQRRNVLATNPALDASLMLLFDGGVGVYAADGRLLDSTPDWQDGESLAGNATYIPLISAGRSATRILIRVPLGDGWIGGIVSLESLASFDLVRSLHESDSTSAYLVSEDGQILYHDDPQRVGTTAPDVVYQPDEHHTEGDNQNIVIQAPVVEARWMLVQNENWEESVSLLTRYSQAAPLILVPGLVIAVGALWFGVSQIVRPLQRLEKRAGDLAWGNFKSIEENVGGIDEIRQLQATLRHMSQRIQAVQAGMHHYIAAITRAQEDERARLARELHDQTSQSLVALDHRQQMLKLYLKENPDALTLLSEIRGMIAAIIEDLRRIVRAMRPIYLEELGLVPALKALVDDLSRDGKIAAHFEKSGDPQRLTPEQEIALYRVAQEALNNIWQHSGASEVWLRVQFEAEQIAIEARDNGHGFVAPHHATDLSDTQHFGLMGMYERAALIGAHLHIQSEPNSGTCVSVQMPIK